MSKRTGFDWFSTVRPKVRQVKKQKMTADEYFKAYLFGLERDRVVSRSSLKDLLFWSFNEGIDFARGKKRMKFSCHGCCGRLGTGRGADGVWCDKCWKKLFR